MIRVVEAGALHARDMAEILDEIISIGGTTAMTTTVTAADIKFWMQSNRELSAWHVAENANGVVLGFQWIEPAIDCPPNVAEIASFVRNGTHGIGVGSALFEKTVRAARKLDYSWIRANIRADNESGLSYYQSRGFEPYDTCRGVRLENGLIVDKVLMKFDL